MSDIPEDKIFSDIDCQANNRIFITIGIDITEEMLYSYF